MCVKKTCKFVAIINYKAFFLYMGKLASSACLTHAKNVVTAPNVQVFFTLTMTIIQTPSTSKILG